MRNLAVSGYTSALSHHFQLTCINIHRVIVVTLAPVLSAGIRVGVGVGVTGLLLSV